MDYGILLGIVSMIGFGIANAVSQKVVRNVGAFSAMAWQSLIASAVLFTVFAFYPSGFSFSWSNVAMTAGIGLFGVIPLFTFYRALASGKIGIVVPIANSFGLVTVLLSFLFLGEALTMAQLSAAVAIMSGIALISFRGETSAKGVPYALATSMLWGIYFFINAYPVAALGPAFTAAFTQAVISAFAFAYTIRTKTLKLPHGHAAKLAFASGAALAAGVAGFDVGITMTDVGVVALISSAAPLVAVTYARIFYKEALTRIQYLAIAMIMGGIIWLSM